MKGSIVSCCIVSLLFAVLQAQVAGSDSSPDLRQSAERALATHQDDHLVELSEPKFNVRAGRLEAYPGFARARPELLKELSIGEAETANFQCLLGVFLIQNYLQLRHPDMARHWRPYLVQAQAISSGESPALVPCNVRVAELLSQAALAYAQAKGLTLSDAERRGTLVTVKFNAIPPTNRIYLVDELVYQIQARVVADDQWRPVGGIERQLSVGDYRIKASWDGGKTWELQLVSVVRAGTVPVARGR